MGKLKKLFRDYILMEYFHLRFNSRDIDDRIALTIQEHSNKDWTLKEMFANLSKSAAETSCNNYDRLMALRTSKIVELLKDKAIFKTNLICSDYGEVSKDTDDERNTHLFTFEDAVCSSEIIKYHCIITVDNGTNRETTYIAIESIAIEELKRIANECSVFLELIEDEARKCTVLSSPYTGISEPQGKYVLTALQELRLSLLKG